MSGKKVSTVLLAMEGMLLLACAGCSGNAGEELIFVPSGPTAQNIRGTKDNSGVAVRHVTDELCVSVPKGVTFGRSRIREAGTGTDISVDTGWEVELAINDGAYSLKAPDLNDHGGKVQRFRLADFADSKGTPFDVGTQPFRNVELRIVRTSGDVALKVTVLKWRRPGIADEATTASYSGVANIHFLTDDDTARTSDSAAPDDPEKPRQEAGAVPKPSPVALSPRADKTPPAPPRGEDEALERAKTSDEQADAAEAPSPVRAWTDASGKFRTEATFAGTVDGKVRLLKTDGQTVLVALTSLSKEDREFVRSQVAGR